MIKPLKSNRATLVAGVRSYPNALFAISEFCLQVQAIWHEQLVRELPSIAANMRIKLDANDLSHYADPSSLKQNVSSEWAALGVKIDKNRVEGCGWTQRYHLTFYDESAFLAAQISFKERSAADRVHTRLREFAREPFSVNKNKWKEVFMQTNGHPRANERR